mmetsp:Transcript_17279/g.42151  ORF Transcript_17279/g.42151 Transcript_17279/m.42151 type:complete len:177 (+) Transcript_17279:20-550(+)
MFKLWYRAWKLHDIENWIVHSDLFMLSVPTCYCDHAKPDSCTHFWTSSGPTSGPTTCVDDPLFLDSYGDDCSWYTANEPLGCPNYGTELGDCTFGRCVANEACCQCLENVPAPAPGVCVDDVSFSDSYGDDCQWYTDNEPRKSNQQGFEMRNRRFFSSDSFLFLLHEIHSFTAYFF